MNLSLQDSNKYIEALTDLAHLVKEWGATSVVLDLHIFFPDVFEELEKEFHIREQNKKLSRLLYAGESGREGTGVVHDSMALGGQSSVKGDK